MPKLLKTEKSTHPKKTKILTNYNTEQYRNKTLFIFEYKKTPLPTSHLDGFGEIADQRIGA